LDRRLEIFPPLSPTGENYWKSISALSGVCHVSRENKKRGDIITKNCDRIKQKQKKNNRKITEKIYHKNGT
jgi:hypothetical protein